METGGLPLGERHNKEGASTSDKMGFTENDNMSIYDTEQQRKLLI